MSENGTPSISYLLDSNTPPKPVEIPVVESRIRDLVDKISELRKLEVELERHRAVLSPVRRIPREVLGHVFTFLHPYEGGEKVRNAAGRKDLLQLSLVCKLWRDATLGTHELWTGLQIRPRHSLESLKSVRAWFSQAGSLPRRLQYEGWTLGDGDRFTDRPRRYCSCGDLYSRPEPRPCLLAASALPQLLTNGPRLDHLTLKCANTVCFGHFLDAMDTLRQDPTTPESRPWDTLRSLSIKFRNTMLQHDPQLGDIIVSHLERLPIVDSLAVDLPSSWSAFDPDFDTSHLELKILPSLIERLTTFYISCTWSGPHLLKLLPHCCNVETLTINFENSGNPLADMGDHPLVRNYSASPFVLPKLRTLRTRMAQDLELLDLMQAPQLVNLDIGMFPTTEKLSEDDLLFPIASFLERSGTAQSLRTFQLRACHIDAEHLFPIISNLNALTALTLDDVKVEMRILGKMFREHDAGIQGGYGLSFSRLERLDILQLPPGYQLDPIVDYIKERGPSLKFQLVASYNVPEQRVMKEEDVRETLRFSRSGVRASIVPVVKWTQYV
ncbi:hypothetical protein DFP72DRAFT_919870 [Ephemerocybe angulata]|uniref:F-box domain-containing protein n=1 Tax=Ephemerocybe angulata TaxID=980116 RepID=A0A8H6M0P5_9AGAR|nr:hypothetical protein DFP72DRAFT_919870 [Tulosesus angulatus]